MTTKFRAAELINRAIEDAIQWNESFMDSISNCTDEEDERVYRETADLVKQLRQYQKRRFLAAPKENNHG